MVWRWAPFSSNFLRPPFVLHLAALLCYVPLTPFLDGQHLYLCRDLLLFSQRKTIWSPHHITLCLECNPFWLLLPNSILSFFWLILRMSSRVMFQKCRSVPISSSLRQFHCLLVALRINSRVLNKVIESGCVVGHQFMAVRLDLATFQFHYTSDSHRLLQLCTVKFCMLS